MSGPQPWNESEVLYEFFKSGCSGDVFSVFLSTLKERSKLVVSDEELFSRLATITDTEAQVKVCLLLADFFMSNSEVESYLIGKSTFGDEPTKLAALTALLRLESLHNESLEKHLINMVSSEQSLQVRYYALVVLIDFSDWPDREENKKIVEPLWNHSEKMNPILERAQNEITEFLIDNQDHPSFFKYAKLPLRISEKEMERYTTSLKNQGKTGASTAINTGAYPFTPSRRN